ncbi:unnamed protein product [Prorocentrum cordatum]|uniref:Purple acid phosphatase n=1 Tax=Prorocentrum cordatum TaxID=2364126 RepID=A0ABN9RJV6_9DINO|nr:unnamed protein product [Polarella glacialis]
MWAPSLVSYGTASGALARVAKGSAQIYSCQEPSCGGPYTSGHLHRAVLGESEGGLQPGVRYFYRCGGGEHGDVFSFVMPHRRLQARPTVIAILGDPGQTEQSEHTFSHIRAADPLVTVLAGDLSYADCHQPRWDSYGRLAEPLAARVPVMSVAGNHEEEPPWACGLSMNASFAAYNARYRNPSAASGSSSNMFYSFESAGVHFLMLASYADFSEASDQLAWLRRDLAKVDRGATPWLVAMVHAPWYNSNYAHARDPEGYKMKAAMERLLRDAKLDAMFAGHVHAYERIHRVFDDELDPCAPAYFNIGAGGNREGISGWYDPNPREWSAVRDGNYGHALLTVHNATHAHFTWHRNREEETTVFDEVWLTKDPKCWPATDSSMVLDGDWLFNLV